MPDLTESAAVVRGLIGTLPLLVRFLLGLSLFLLVPSLSRRVRIPGVVGLMLAGILLGKSGVQLWPEDAPVLDLFAEIGKLLVLFYAGLEVDAMVLRRSGMPAAVFAFSTLVLPMSLGFLAARALGYDMLQAVLMASLVGSHSIIAFPIVKQLGLEGRESVTVTMGATVVTDVITLLMLSVCVSIHVSGFDAAALAIQIAEVVAYAALVLLALPRLMRNFVADATLTRDVQLLVLLAVVTVAALLAQLIKLEPIVGAFLAGLAVSKTLRGSEARAHFESLGNTLFVPAFFLAIGLSIDARAAARTLAADPLPALGLLLALVTGKFAAAWFTGAIRRYPRPEWLMMWSLSLPQVAGTIAATLVAYETVDPQGRRLIDEPVMNAILVLVLLTAVGGPILTERFGRKLAPAVEGAP
jgi:Kef-type K+ transport system membrane component KefB